MASHRVRASLPKPPQPLLDTPSNGRSRQGRRFHIRFTVAGARTLKKGKQIWRQKAAELSKTVAVAECMLPVVVAQRKRNVKTVTGSRHGHIKQPALFLYF